MKILGIETSCDETAAAVVENGTQVQSNTVTSSLSQHVKTGGIIPEVAARRQIESIIPVIENSLKIAKLKIEDVDAIAVTYGPGLIGSLLVGVETAKTLSMVFEKPIVPVNHLVAHLYANFINNKPKFPLVGLVVSGGHTDFVYMKSHGHIKYLGGTRDDAAGEAFDKTARLLGLAYPGGPAIAEAANRLLSTDYGELDLFPRPMLNSNNLDMSFSGLKTSVSRYLAEDRSPKSVDIIAAEVQEAIVDTLVAKSIKAVEKYEPKSFLLAGGVSANQRLREKISDALSNKTAVFIPEPIYSTDNAVMIAAAAFYNYKPVPWQKVSANPSLSIEE